MGVTGTGSWCIGPTSLLSLRGRVMSPNSLAVGRLRPRGLLRRRSRLRRVRVRLADGAQTTLHVVSYDRRAVNARVGVLEQPTPLVRWCRTNGVREAVGGG